MMLGDLKIVGDEPVPAKLLKALAVIADRLHPEFNLVRPKLTPDISRKSCVLASLAVRDFLWKIGFKDAAVRTVYLAVRAHDATTKQEIHSLGVGDHTKVPTLKGNHLTDTRRDWSGHMVVSVGGFLIDSTLYQMARPQWPDLPGMMVVPLWGGSLPEVFDLPVIAGEQAKQADGSMLSLMWMAQPNERWRDGGDGADRGRRAPVVKALVKKFGPWRD